MAHKQFAGQQRKVTNMTNYKICLLVLAISTFTRVSSADVTPLDCEAEFKAAEQCFSTLMIGVKNILWTKENSKSVCASKFEAIDCIQNYRKKCVTGMPNMVFSMISKKFNTTFSYLCSNETALEEVLYHFNCLRNSIFSDDVKKCGVRSQLKLELIDSHGLDAKIPIICCSFVNLKQCMTENLKTECDESKDHSVIYMNGLINKFAGDLSKMFCMEYKNADSCLKKLHPDTLAEMNEIDSYDYQTAKSKKKFSSFLRLIKHLVEQPIS